MCTTAPQLSCILNASYLRVEYQIGLVDCPMYSTDTYFRCEHILKQVQQSKAAFEMHLISESNKCLKKDYLLYLGQHLTFKKSKLAFEMHFISESIR